MEFELTEEQKQIKMSVREFAEAEIAPHVMEWDETQHFPIELKPKLAELGLMGVLFPEKYGGAGMGYVEYATIIDELSRVDGSVGISIAAHNSLCSNHIYEFGNEEQRQKYLVPLASGQHLGAWGLTEPSAGSDASGTRSTAVRQGDGWGRQWFQKLHHACDSCGYLRRCRRHRSRATKQGNHRVCFRKGHERVLAVEEGKQTRLARFRNGKRGV
jgi:alkylation response protein AidB-like acyl-CoA dehydrogenase